MVYIQQHQKENEKTHMSYWRRLCFYEYFPTDDYCWNEFQIKNRVIGRNSFIPRNKVSQKMETAKWFTFSVKEAFYLYSFVKALAGQKA